MKKVVYIEGVEFEDDKLLVNRKEFSGLDVMTIKDVLRLLANEGVLKIEIKEY